MPEQCFVRNRYDRAAVVGELGHEQSVLDELIDQRTAPASGQLGPWGTLAADVLVTILLDAHQGVEDLRQLCLRILGQFRENRFGSLRKRTLYPAELGVGRERERPVIGATLVQLFERELQ